jgi:hypothetical protein
MSTKAKRYIRTFFYGPPNWLVRKFSAEDRMMFGFWVVVFAVTGNFIFGRFVLWVSWLSAIALIPNFTTETPVVKEENHET